MKIFFSVIILLVLCANFLFGQNDNTQVGSSLNQLRQSQGAFYDYSDPEAVNIKVAVWGFVRYPGKYIIPSYSNVDDLLSYAGGPTDAARLENLQLIRTNTDSLQSVIKLNYDDVMFADKGNAGYKLVALKPADILLVKGEPRLYFKDYLSITLSVVSTLISLAILILNIAK